MDFAQRRGSRSGTPKSLPSDTSWVFDVDGCLIDSLTGMSLRPGSRALLDHLVSQGCRVILWSAGGGDYARARATQFGIEHLADGFFDKDGREGGTYCIGHLPTGTDDAVFVDDRPEDLDASLDVMAVSPYLTDDPHDRGLHAVARRAGLELFGPGVRVGTAGS